MVMRNRSKPTLGCQSGPSAFSRSLFASSNAAGDHTAGKAKAGKGGCATECHRDGPDLRVVGSAVPRHACCNETFRWGRIRSSVMVELWVSARFA